jgi:D-aminopeptidase
MNEGQARARALGITPGRLPTGEQNSIVDVAGVRVGQVTICEGEDLRTGVTAVVPDAVDLAGGRLPAGLFVGNGYGKLIGATQLVELGAIETPVLLTGTLSAFRAADALVSYVLAMPGNEELHSVNPVVGETNDGFLSDIRRRPVTERHVHEALTSAHAGWVAEGCVGAGTGTAALGFKAGIGTSSRIIELKDHGRCTVGVLVQSNFSGTLTVLGVPIPKAEVLTPPPPCEPPHHGNSCMIVVAVDLGLDARQLSRVARRAVFGLARVGSDFAGGSGDYAIAFTVGSQAAVEDSVLDPVFLAAQEAVEEAVLNSLFMAHTTVGYQGHTKYAVPQRFVRQRCRAAGVLGRG